MDFDMISQPFFQKFIQAVCLTLLHSVWQGFVAAVLVGAILLLTSKQKPAFRYNLLCAVLILFVISSGLTFYWEMQTESEVLGSVHLSVTDANFPNPANADVSVDTAAETFVWIDFLTGFCNQNAEWIVAMWFLIFGLKSVQAVTGIFYLRRIRRQNIYEPEEGWKGRFLALADKLQISDRILLMESENVTVPMVIGFFKPMVLIPLGLLTNLPASQVEAILLHELAHIRRRDYLVNLMQIFCENVFFFNPAVLWISFLIKEEREHCCDDLAISVIQNKSSFIHALVSFQEYNQSAPAFGMAFSKKRNHLLGRIKRIINNNNKPLDAMEKLFVTISLVAVAALSAAVSRVNPEKEKLVLTKTEIPEIVNRDSNPVILSATPTDTLPKKKKERNTVIHSANVYSGQEGVSTYNVSMNGKHYDIIQKDGKTTELSINGKEIPENEIASYQTEIDGILEEIKVAHERAEIDRRKADERREEANVLRQKAEVNRQRADEQRVQADKLREEAELNRQQAEKGRIEASKMREEAGRMRKDAEHQRAEAEKHRAEADVARKRAEEFRYEAEKNRQEYEKMQNGLIDDLIAAGVIKGISDLSYKLSQDELIVNGVKQSADLHEKLKSKYIKDKALEMVYNFKGKTGYTTTGFIYTK